MARRARYFLADQPLHIIQRGNNRQRIFFSESDSVRYRDWLMTAAAEYGCAIHGYVLMTNHVHLLVTPRAVDSVPRLMQSLGRRYVRRVNRLYRRSGTLWEGRYRAAPVEGEAYFLACCRYIELNPVRAGMVAAPGDYRWSSWPAHAAGRPDPLTRGHPLYEALGATPAARQRAYRALFGEPLADDFLDAVRAATNGGWALGGKRFAERIAAAIGRRATPLPPGRKPSRRPGDTQLILL
jgi:putative transposase